jgi:hypothetical protein
VLEGPELVYVDTFGSVVETSLGLLDASCRIDRSTCTDGACAGEQSQLVAFLPRGTHVFAVEIRGGDTASGRIDLRVEHVRVGDPGAGLLLADRRIPPGAFTLTGTTAGEPNSPDSARPAPDRWYYWTTCNDPLTATLRAETCGGATWDTVLELRNGSGVPGGLDDNGCSMQSRLTGNVARGAGLHVLFVDGSGAGDSGSFRVTGTRP